MLYVYIEYNSPTLFLTRTRSTGAEIGDFEVLTEGFSVSRTRLRVC